MKSDENSQRSDVNQLAQTLQFLALRCKAECKRILLRAPSCEREFDLPE